MATGQKSNQMISQRPYAGQKPGVRRSPPQWRGSDDPLHSGKRPVIVIKNLEIVFFYSIIQYKFMKYAYTPRPSAYFTHLKCQKRIGDDVGEMMFLPKKNENDPLIRFIHLIMQEYDSICLKMYLITLKFVKKCLPRSPKSMKGSQIHLALAHWK
jgi:hypothetical protein